MQDQLARTEGGRTAPVVHKGAATAKTCHIYIFKATKICLWVEREI